MTMTMSDDERVCSSFVPMLSRRAPRAAVGEDGFDLASATPS
jgi:hypothetical protein